MQLSRNFGPLFYTTLLQLIEFGGYLFIYSSLKVLPQFFSQVGVWIFSDPLQHCTSILLFQSVLFCVVLWIIVLTKFGRSFCRAHLSLEYFCTQRSSGLTQWLQGSQVLCLQNKLKSTTPPMHWLFIWDVCAIMLCVILPNMLHFWPL